jgi:uncharacterized membrane protein (DUF485 family)
VQSARYWPAPAAGPGASATLARSASLIPRERWLIRPALDRAAQELGLTLSEGQRAQITHEQLSMVLLHTRVGTVAATLFAALLVAHLRGTVADGLLLGWLAIKVLVAATRIVLAQVYVRRAARQVRPGHIAPQWQRAMLALLALDGLVWGLAGWHLVHGPVAVAALATAALDGVSCVATFGLQVRVAATAAYTLPMLLPMALGLALRRDEVGWFGAPGQLSWWACC